MHSGLEHLCKQLKFFYYINYFEVQTINKYKNIALHLYCIVYIEEYNIIIGTLSVEKTDHGSTKIVFASHPTQQLTIGKPVLIVM